MSNKSKRMRNWERRQRNLTAFRTNLISVWPIQIFQRSPLPAAPRNPDVFHFEARSINANIQQAGCRHPVPRSTNLEILRPTIENLQSSTVSRPNYGMPKGDREVEVTSDGIMKIQVASTEDKDTDDEVQYLYTVDTNAGLVELVDLSEESKPRNNSCGNHNLTSSRLSTSEAKIISTVTTKESSTIIQNLSNGASIPCITLDSKKNPVPTNNKRKRDGEAYCIVCDTSYEKACNNGAELFSSRCGHLFCRPCLGILNPYKCSMCNREITNVKKIYL